MIKNFLPPKEFRPALYSDYLDGRPQAAGFFGRHFAELPQLGEYAAGVAASFGGDRDRLVEMLLAYNREMGCSVKTEGQVKKLADPRSVAVLTGQQAGLCTGPLYTVYKAISAVKLAQKLELQWGRPVVPIFWIASEDHDFSEANHFSLLDRDNRLQRISLEVEHRGEPVGMLTLDNGAAARVVEELAGLIQVSEFSEAALDFLRDTAEASATVAQWFARIFSILFADRGLVLFDPLLPESRRMLIPFYLKAVESVAEAGETLREREQALLAAGYPLQVEREEEASLLMYISGKRSALYRRGSDFATRDGAAVYSKESLCRLIEDEPDKISPNVLLRPLAQDSLFPTIVYIPGAGELSYFAQLLPLYHIFGLTPPVLQPRGGLTVIEPRLKRYLERYDLPEQDILGGLDGYLKKTLTAKAGVDLDAVFGRLRGKIEEEYRLLKQELSRLDGQMPGLTDKNMQRVWTEIEYLRQKAEQQAKRKNETVVRHFDNLEQALLPLGRLQERVLNIFPFMIKYGPDFGQKIYREFPAEPGHHLFYYEQTSV